MSITEELRYCLARELASWKMTRERYDEIIAIADRIDEKHDELRELASELYEAAWLEYPSAFEHTYADRLRNLGVNI